MTTTVPECEDGLTCEKVLSLQCDCQCILMMLHTSDIYVCTQLYLLTTRAQVLLNFGAAAARARCIIVTWRWACVGNAGTGKVLRGGYRCRDDYVGGQLHI